MISITLLNIAWQICVLGLVTLGLAIVFGQLKIMNMAHGEFVMMGAYAPIIVQSSGFPSWLQIPICVAVVAITAWIIERFIVRYLYGRLFDSLLATWGIAICLRELVILVFGRGYQFVPLPIEGATELLTTSYPTYRLVVMIFTFTTFLGLFYWYNQSMIGTKIKAMAHNPELAQVVGINTGRLRQRLFIFGCTSSGLAGLLIAPTTRIDPNMGLDYLVRSFFALVTGGLGSFEGLLIGSSLIGGMQSLTSTMFNQTTGYILILVISVFFLWLKPHGLFTRSN